MLVLGTVEEEAAACRAAWADSSIGDLAMHCHHEIMFEILTESAEGRIAYILREKAGREQPLRLRLFRPAKTDTLVSDLVKGDVIGIMKADADRRKAYAYSLKAADDRQKADTARRKAYAYWLKAHRQKAELPEEDSARGKAYADYQKACVVWEKFYADRQKALCDHHDLLCQTGCPWNGYTIFS